jgi:hypothetical protein
MPAVRFQTVISGDMRCSLRYDLAILLVRIVLIPYSFAEPTAIEVFRLVFQIPGGCRRTRRQL